MQALDFKGRKRDPAWERELYSWLRQQPEERRFEFLSELLEYHVIVGLQLANKTLESRDSFRKLLAYAVSNCDASSIKFWLESVVPRLGYRRSVSELEKLLESDPSGVDKAVYWMPRLANSDKDRESLETLTMKLEAR